MVNEVLPGTRVKVFDHRLFKDDQTTPLSETMQLATVVQRYGRRNALDPTFVFPDLIDVEFDYRPGEISRSHFTDYAEVIGATE